MEKGKLIVFEGIDGSGKSAHYRRVCSRLEAEGINYHHIVFPRYDNDSSALIRMYLGGRFGSNPSDVNAYTASAFFAVDRFASYRTDWGDIYNSGGFVLSDRYTTSNAVHQGAKLPDEELPAFFEWLYDFEYVKLGLPKPDLVIYLDVDVETSLRRMKHRQEKTHTSADIHEKDIEYLKNCLRVADKAADYYGWTRIPFKKNGVEREIDEKHDNDNYEVLDVGHSTQYGDEYSEQLTMDAVLKHAEADGLEVQYEITMVKLEKDGDRVTGLIAKEEVVNTFGVLYNYAGEIDLMEDSSPIWALVAADFNALTTYSFMIFNLLCAPCFAAMGAIKREMNNAKWTWFAIGYQCGFAYCVSLMINQFGNLFTGNVNVIGLIFALAVLGCMIYMLVRPYKEADKLTAKV